MFRYIRCVAAFLTCLIAVEDFEQTIPGRITIVVAAAEGGADCLPLRELEFVSKNEKIRNSMTNADVYFCAHTAPQQFYCRCPSSTVCKEFLSADGRDLGQCRCCAGWIYGILGALALMGLGGVSFLIYLMACKGKWWCDGYHPAVTPFLPRRGAPVVIPSSLPLPSGVFRGYKASDFDTGLSAEDLALAREQHQRQRQAAQDLSRQQQLLRIEQRRRRRQRAGADDEEPLAQTVEEYEVMSSPNSIRSESEDE